MTKDVVKRPFITVGFTAFVLMIPLALTSTQWAIRWLGKKWQPLHRLIYAIAIAGVIHYIWLVKKDLRKPLIYASILAMLLLYRLIVWAWRQASSPQAIASPGRSRRSKNCGRRLACRSRNSSRALRYHRVSARREPEGPSHG